MIQSDAKRIVIEAGFIAATQGWVEQASTILSAVAILSPDSNAHVIGQSLSLLSSRRFEAAQTLLEDRLKSHGEDDDVRAILGLVLQASGKSSESLKVLEKLKDKSGPHAEMAKALMEE